jgi:hypothetical protein
MMAGNYRRNPCQKNTSTDIAAIRPVRSGGITDGMAPISSRFAQKAGHIFLAK